MRPSVDDAESPSCLQPNKRESEDPAVLGRCRVAWQSHFSLSLGSLPEGRFKASTSPCAAILCHLFAILIFVTSKRSVWYSSMWSTTLLFPLILPSRISFSRQSSYIRSCGWCSRRLCLRQPGPFSASEDGRFHVAWSTFVHQAGDLGYFKCPTCAKPYVSKVWYRNLNICPPPAGAIVG